MKTVGMYRYGEAKACKGLCIGTAGQVPRGIRHEDYVSKGYFDVWMPLAAPSKELRQAYKEGECDVDEFFARYRREMKEVTPRHAIDLLAAVARVTPIYLGCFCEDENQCHRVVLKELVEEAIEHLPK